MSCINRGILKPREVKAILECLTDDKGNSYDPRHAAATEMDGFTKAEDTNQRGISTKHKQNAGISTDNQQQPTASCLLFEHEICVRHCRACE